MRSTVAVLALAVMLSVGSLRAEPVSYEGMLSGPGGGGDGTLFITGWEWNWPETTLEWVVDNTTTPGKWHYWYRVTVPEWTSWPADVQCVIIEATSPDPGPAFTEANLSSLSVQPPAWYQTHQIGWHGPDPLQTPALPGDIYGLLLCSEADPFVLTISFDSDRAPRWGDFYATSGVMSVFAPHVYNALYNAGFEAPDPLSPPSDGSVNNHVLVPDGVIPAPAAVLLGGIGAVLTGLSRRRGWL